VIYEPLIKLGDGCRTVTPTGGLLNAEGNPVIITCNPKPVSGSCISITTKGGQLIDTFDVPTRNGLAYCMSHYTSKYTRRLRHGADIALRLENQPANDAGESQAA
jgi:hypothetical protein